MPEKVLRAAIIRQTNTRVIVDAVLDDPAGEQLTVRYVMNRNPDTGKLTIISRRDKYPDYRYDPCVKRSRHISR
ncbi:hypothetical protein ACFQI7_19020 [Paenibacillus allorhizosphaerae]|uniref:hypothetical protein n=1 Tax=Paenibacillus allorhizosphaerae TaxID=2849866 RepID=UPI001C408A9A|nr:hypothetical protein [Paenibacillus allorhizosphaerae]